MARESFSFPESRMMEIIEILKVGLMTLGPNVFPDTRKSVEYWCKENEEYAREVDYRSDIILRPELTEL
jgi:hypothetical protein